MDEGARASRRCDAVFVAALVALSFFRSGFGALPTNRFYATTFVDALPDVPRLLPRNQWVLWSPLGPIVSRIIGMHSTRGFLFLHVLVVLAGLAVLVFSVRKQYGSIAMRVVLVAFVALPVSVVLQAWFGSYDAWVFLLSTTIVVTGSWTVAAVAGFGLALANFEQGAFIVAMLDAGRRSRTARFVATIRMRRRGAGHRSDRPRDLAAPQRRQVRPPRLPTPTQPRLLADGRAAQLGPAAACRSSVPPC